MLPKESIKKVAPQVSENKFRTCTQCNQNVIVVAFGNGRKICDGCFYVEKEKEEGKNTTEKKNAIAEITGDLWGVSMEDLPNSCGIVPNCIARSGLFGMSQGEMVENHKIECSQKIIEITYTGRMLGHEHFLIWVACLKQALIWQSLNFTVRRIDLMGLTHINTSSKRLREIIDDLQNAKIDARTIVRRLPTEFSGRFIESCEKVANGTFEIKLNPLISAIIRDDYTIFNLNKNNAIKGRMARALHPYFASHRQGCYSFVSFDALRSLSRSSAGDARNQLPYQIKKALLELKNHGIISEFKIMKSKKSKSNRVVRWFKYKKGEA